MWRNVWAVIRREYLQRVRSKWFVAATIGGPVLMAAIFFFPVYMGMRSDEGESRVAVVDATGVLYERIAPELERGGWRVERVEWTSDVLGVLERRAEEGEITGFLVLDDVTLRTGEATFHTLSRLSPLRSMIMRSAVTYAALSYNLEASGVDAASMLRGGDLRVELLSDAGSGTDDPRFAVAYGGAFFLYMVILIYAVAVMRATLEEKTSRIVEVVISSMEPWHLMLGKILGVGAVSFTQMAVWLTTAVLIGGAGIPALLAAQPQLGDLGRLSEVLPGVGLLALFVGFFVFGFFMYSGLYAAVGAMCSTHDEAQQAQFPLVMLLVVPILMVMPVIQSPMTPMATGLSLFPLFSPILMWTRVASASVPVWQVALSFVLMALAVLAIAWLAGRIYKVGILMTGKRPTLPELWRWVKEA
jgi:ABC-2 type transport system permease protein